MLLIGGIWGLVAGVPIIWTLISGGSILLRPYLRNYHTYVFDIELVKQGASRHRNSLLCADMP